MGWAWERPLDSLGAYSLYMCSTHMCGYWISSACVALRHVSDAKDTLTSEQPLRHARPASSLSIHSARPAFKRAWLKCSLYIRLHVRPVNMLGPCTASRYALPCGLHARSAHVRPLNMLGLCGI